MRHRNARTTLWVRHEIVNLVGSGMPKAAVARRFGVSRQTVHKWWRRHVEGDRELVDRSSRPRRMPRLVVPAIARIVCRARQRTGYGPARLAGYLRMACSSVWKILKRAGLNRLPKEPREPVVRYEHPYPGSMLHVDIKKLRGIGSVPGHRITGDRRSTGRKDEKGSGWEYVHVAIDDRTRLAYAEVLASERAVDASAFLKRATAWYASNGITIERVLTDNGPCYRSDDWQATCIRHRIRPRYTRSYRPQTNGKAERLIRTMLNEWAYPRAYAGNAERSSALPQWLDQYNTRRYHTSCKSTPWQRAVSDLANVNNVCEPYT